VRPLRVARLLLRLNTPIPAARARLLLGATVLVVLGQGLTWLLLRSQGNDLGGDQVHYLIAGQALSHLSLHPLPEYQRDFMTRFIYNWAPGASVSNHAIVQTYPGPHGSVFAHGLGLPLLLSPFLAIGSVPLALLGLFTLNALGLVLLHQRASSLADLGRQGQLVFALVMAAPALWLASTQVYPDFVSGVLLAVTLVEIAHSERDRHLSVCSAAVVAAALAFVPWLQIKNLAPALCCVVALGALALRQHTQRQAYLTVGIVVLAGWGLLALYDQYYFANLVGLPQPSPTFTLTTASRTLALLFDSHQGLVVQTPTVMLGVVGLWLARRTVPWAAGAAAVASIAMLVINGTYTSAVPFGGTALAGRFEWTVAPMLLAWAPFCLATRQARARRLLGLSVVVAALWLAQGFPILRGDHVYVNSMFAPFAPWDPGLYPGWWPVVGRFLPDFLAPGLHLASTWTHLVVELLVAGAAAWLLLQWGRPEPLRVDRRLAVPAGFLLAAAILLAAGPTRTAPVAPLTYSGPAVGAPWSGGTLPNNSPLVELSDVGPGTYTVTVPYAAAPGSHAALATLNATPERRPIVSGWFTPRHPTDAAALRVTPAPLELGIGPTVHTTLSGRPGHRVATLTIEVTDQSVLSFFVTVQAHSSFDTSGLTLTKLNR
jgi:hypothetical protein